MNETEWKLRKDNAQLKAQLAQVQSQLCQVLFDAAQKEGAALGEAWPAPDGQEPEMALEAPRMKKVK